MSLQCRGEHVLGGLHTGINTKHIFLTSKMVIIFSYKNKKNSFFSRKYQSIVSYVKLEF